MYVPAASSLVSGILVAATLRLRTPLSNVKVDITDGKYLLSASQLTECLLYFVASILPTEQQGLKILKKKK